MNWDEVEEQHQERLRQKLELKLSGPTDDSDSDSEFPRDPCIFFTPRLMRPRRQKPRREAGRCPSSLARLNSSPNAASRCHNVGDSSLHINDDSDSEVLWLESGSDRSPQSKSAPEYDWHGASMEGPVVRSLAEGSSPHQKKEPERTSVSPSEVPIGVSPSLQPPDVAEPEACSPTHPITESDWCLSGYEEEEGVAVSPDPIPPPKAINIKALSMPLSETKDSSAVLESFPVAMAPPELPLTLPVSTPSWPPEPQAPTTDTETVRSFQLQLPTLGQALAQQTCLVSTAPGLDLPSTLRLQTDAHPASSNCPPSTWGTNMPCHTAMTEFSYDSPPITTYVTPQDWPRACHQPATNSNRYIEEASRYHCHSTCSSASHCVYSFSHCQPPPVNYDQRYDYPWVQSTSSFIPTPLPQHHHNPLMDECGGCIGPAARQDVCSRCCDCHPTSSPSSFEPPSPHVSCIGSSLLGSVGSNRSDRSNSKRALETVDGCDGEQLPKRLCH